VWHFKENISETSDNGLKDKEGLTMNGSSRLMGNTGFDGSIIVGCGCKRRGWGAMMGIGGIVDCGPRELRMK
jgi:hypothetical protein